jgi:hypothetical protein
MIHAPITVRIASGISPSSLVHEKVGGLSSRESEQAGYRLWPASLLAVEEKSDGNNTSMPYLNLAVHVPIPTMASGARALAFTSRCSCLHSVTIFHILPPPFFFICHRANLTNEKGKKRILCFSSSRTERDVALSCPVLSCRQRRRK